MSTSTRPIIQRARFALRWNTRAGLRLPSQCLALRGQFLSRALRTGYPQRAEFLPAESLMDIASRKRLRTRGEFCERFRRYTRDQRK